MNSFTSNAAIPYKVFGQELFEMCSTYFYETLHVLNDKYSDLFKEKEKMFMSKD